MRERRRGFLWNDERTLVDAYAGTPSANVDIPLFTEKKSEYRRQDQRREKLLSELARPSDVKYRMENGICTPEELRETLLAIEKDLHRVENFYQNVVSQPHGRWYWVDHVLPVIQSEIEQLTLRLELWEQNAESTADEHVRDVLSTAISPLHDGLNTLNQHLEERTFSPVEVNRAREDAENAHEGLASDLYELRERRRALMELLGDENLHELFKHIADNPGQKLPEKNIGGNPWTWWASRELETKHNLIEEKGWSYHLTDRGKVVEDVLANITDLSIMRFVDDDETAIGETALTLIHHHFPTEEWLEQN